MPPFALIAFGFSEFDQFRILIQFPDERVVTRYPFLQPCTFAHDLLRVFRIVPKVGVFSERVQLV